MCGKNHYGCVIVNCICQLDWATECPDIWSHITLGVSVMVFLGDINIWIGRLRFPCLMWVGLIHSVEDLNRTKRLSKSQCLSAWAETLVFSSLWTWTETLTLPGFRACQLSDWNLYHRMSCLSGLQERNGTTRWPSCISSFPTADLGTSQPPYSHEPIPPYIHILILWRTLTNPFSHEWPKLGKHW